MVKITSKLYRPADLSAVISALEDCLLRSQQSKFKAPDIVIDLRKMGYKIVKVDEPNEKP